MSLSNILSRLFSGTGSSTHTMQPTAQRETVHLNVQGRPVRLRQGKWVVVGEGKVGIVNDMTHLPQVGVMLTDDRGDNLIQTYWPMGDLTIAKMEQIPSRRRPDPDTCRRLGYF